MSFPPEVRIVGSWGELLGERFAGEVNAFCLPRELVGDFHEVVSLLKVERGITHLSEEMLAELALSHAGQLAVKQMQQDVNRLVEHGLQPSLDAVNGYTHELSAAHLRTDVCSWHVDSATAEADTFLCTYHGASTEAVPSSQATCRVLVPELRQLLLQEYGGTEGTAFQEWLEEEFHDLHYHLLPEAQPYCFGVGSVWRVATRYPGAAVEACIHRAPDPVLGQKRLLLIS